MTSDALLILQSIFTTVWSIFTSWHIPGTHVTPAMFFIFLILAGVVWSWFRSFFGSMPSTVSVARDIPGGVQSNSKLDRVQTKQYQSYRYGKYFKGR